MGADRLAPAKPPAVRRDQRIAGLLTLPGAERLDQRVWDNGEVRISYRATDPLWGSDHLQEGMVGLREHLRRLCVSAHELSSFPLQGRWHDVAHNLELAHALTDLFADTDLDESSMWCSPAAEYESANSEVAAKHLASVIVFTFVWTAYECAVDMMISGGGGKGARGRDLVASVAPGHLPHLRETLLTAVELDPGGTDTLHRDMRRMLDAGSWAGIAAEHLRQFRNRSTHGDLPKPNPTDWGPRSEYVADMDPRLRRFSFNIRLTLMLLQILAAADVEPGAELETGVEAPCDAKRLLLTLHCEQDPDGDQSEPEHGLDFGEPPPPAPGRMWR